MNFYSSNDLFNSGWNVSIYIWNELGLPTHFQGNTEKKALMEIPEVTWPPSTWFLPALFCLHISVLLHIDGKTGSREMLYVKFFRPLPPLFSWKVLSNSIIIAPVIFHIYLSIAAVKHHGTQGKRFPVDLHLTLDSLDVIVGQQVEHSDLLVSYEDWYEEHETIPFCRNYLL